MLPVIQFGSLALPVGPFITLLAWYAGIEVSTRGAARRGLSAERTFNACALAAVAGVLAARVAYIVPRLDGYLQDWPQMFALNLNALNATLGAAVGLLAGFIYLARRMPLAEIADALTPGLALALALIAFGNWMTGDGYGVPARNLPWAVNYLNDLRHPAQLYEMATDFAVFALLWFGLTPRSGQATDGLTAKSRLASVEYMVRPGDACLLGIVLLAGARVWLEPFRADSQIIFAGLRGVQAGALALATLAALAYMQRHFSLKAGRR